MPCFAPLAAFKDSSGVRILGAVSSFNGISNLTLPCGQCSGCRLERSRQWAIRCMHEAQLHEASDFLTLTYSPENLPDNGNLCHRHFQLFIKRLRKFTGIELKYYMCGEYGERLGRPHYHAIIFGYSFTDKRFYKNSYSGLPLYVSDNLNRLWRLGNCYIGAVTFESAAYVSRYIMKKVTGKAADAFYTSVNTDTGEIFLRVPEYNRMSLKNGGIAGKWFEKFGSDVFPHDRVIVNGSPQKPPRFYDKLFGRSNPDKLVLIKSKRMLDMAKRLSDNTPQRLNVKSLVLDSKLNLLKRKL